jgi:hypothetical protein
LATRSALRRTAVVAAAITVAGTVAAAGSSPASAATLPVPAHGVHSTHLPSRSVHPGSVLIAFRTAVAAQHGRISTRRADALAANLPAAAVANETRRVNTILAGLHATSLRHLFTNIPAAQLEAARARAMKSSGRYLTDLTQVYQVTFDPSINDGDAANRLASSGLVWTAMPDIKYSVPVHDEKGAATSTSTASKLLNRTTKAAASTADAAALPVNYSYLTDGQSYYDAASNDVTGAITELAKTFHKTPGQGEYITNISLGTIDDSSTVVENGQRYLEQTGFPRIPAYLSHQACTTDSGGTQSCSDILDGDGTNTSDGQGDLTEVLLDFSVMAPPPRGDSRVPNPQPPGQLGEILGGAYGANYRLINPLVNGTPDFVGAWLGAGFLQSPRPTAINASIGDGLGGDFPSEFFEAETLIRDIVTTLVQGQDIFVTISSGDGQDNTDAAGPPDGSSGDYNVTNNAALSPDLDATDLTDPNFTYLWTSEPRLIPDSGSTDAGGTTLNDIFNSSPNNWLISTRTRHTQTTTETRWTGQQNFHAGVGNRVNLAAPADDVLYLAQVEDGNGNPVDPISVEPELIGGTSASSPEIAGAAAVLRQVAALSGHPLTAVQTRNLLAATGHQNALPTFDLAHHTVGTVLDLTAAVNAVLARAHVHGTPEFVRMTVADRKAIPYNNGYGRGFYTDTPQDPVARTASIDLSQGLSADSFFNLEKLAPTGDNLTAPITFGVDAAFLPSSARYSWWLSYGSHSVKVPSQDFDPSRGSLRLLPSEIFSLLHLSTTSSTARVIGVTAKAGGQSITEKVTFAALPTATTTHAAAPYFNTVVRDSSGGSVKVGYDLRGVRNATGGELIVSDIDRALPRAFSDRDIDSHGIKIPLHGLHGFVNVPLSSLLGAGTYGLALRATNHGTELNGLDGTDDSTSAWIPLRVEPTHTNATPTSPQVLAAASPFGTTVPVWWDVADTEPTGSSKFAVSYDVRKVSGAKGTLVEFSAPSTDWLAGLFSLNASGLPVANVFTNPLGDRLDKGDRLGQAGDTGSQWIKGSTHGVKVFDAFAVGMTLPADPTNCDHTYQVRVFATDGQGRILGGSSYTSLLSVANLASPGCNS